MYIIVSIEMRKVGIDMLVCHLNNDDTSILSTIFYTYIKIDTMFLAIPPNNKSNGSKNEE